MTKVLFRMWGQSNIYFGGPNITQITHRSQPVSQSQNISREISYHPFLPNVPEWQYSRYLLEWRFFYLWHKYWVLNLFIVVIRVIGELSQLINHFLIGSLPSSSSKRLSHKLQDPFNAQLQFWKPPQINDLIRQRIWWPQNFSTKKKNVKQVEIIVNFD